MTGAPYFFSTVANDTRHEPFPHRFYMKGGSQAEHLDDALNWCTEHFGPGGPWHLHHLEPHAMWVWNNLGDIHLSDPRQALEFRMRWC
ncbi:MAG: hypothetical protein EOO77_20115 [Oxalobacteraceae bacterium]|nr:MAG: hypothetical protein EOO77_20115 [Oxalobacteraceae bacterium]